MRTRHSILALACFAFPLAGCSQTITRTTTMTAHEAIVAGQGDIVSVEQDGKAAPIAAGQPSAGDGAHVVLRDGRPVTLPPDATVTVERRYRKGDTVPGEGVVTVGPSVSMLIAGGVTLAFTGLLTAGMLGCVSSYSQGGSWNFSSSCSIFFGPQIAAAGATGLILLAGGLVPRAYVSKSVELVPTVGPQQAGATLSVRF